LANSCEPAPRPPDEPPRQDVVELGLGNGRTYHHLRERLTGWRIVAFERLLTAHPSSIPPEGDLILGDIEETVPRFADTDGRCARLIHADLGDGIEDNDRVLERVLPPLVVMLAAPGARVLSSTRLDHPHLIEEDWGDATAGYAYCSYRLETERG
jgi:hypothetical protein